MTNAAAKPTKGYSNTVSILNISVVLGFRSNSLYMTIKPAGAIRQTKGIIKPKAIVIKNIPDIIVKSRTSNNFNIDFGIRHSHWPDVYGLKKYCDILNILRIYCYYLILCNFLHGSF